MNSDPFLDNDTPTADVELTTFPLGAMDSRPDVTIVEEPRASAGSLLQVGNKSTMSLVTRVLDGRTMRQQVKSCFIDIIPIALNVKGNLATTHATPGILRYRKTCLQSLRAADISFQNAILICHTMRRLKTQLAEKQPISAQGLNNLKTVIIQLRDRAEDAYTRLWEVNREQHLLLSSPEAFMPSHEQKKTSFLLPSDMEQGSVAVRIIKLIKAQMTYMVGTDNVPDIFEHLNTLITDSDTAYDDRIGIMERISLLTSRLTELSDLIGENRPTHTWREIISGLYATSFNFVKQIPPVNDCIPTDSEIRFLEETREAIARLRNAWFTVASFDETQPKPVNEWLPDDLDCCSRAILSRRVSLPDIPRQMVDFIVILTRVEKLESGQYALSMNVKCRLDNQPEHTSTLLRCNKLDIVVSLGQLPSPKGLRLRITGHGPSQIFYDKTKRKYGSTMACNVVPAPFGEVGFEVSREITKSNYSVMEAHQKKHNTVYWTISRNKDSNAGISDCDLGVIVDAPTPEIQIEVDIKAYFEVERRFKIFSFIRGRTRALKLDSDPTIINVEEALAMEFSNVSQGEEEFLSACKLNIPS